MANPLDPAQTALGLDVAVTSATVDVRVNDVPAFDPVAPFGSPANITTRLPLNPAFRQGRNSVTVSVAPMEGAAGFETEFRGRLRWWPAGEPGLPFGEDAFAVSFALIATEAGDLRLVAELGTQEHLSISGLESYTNAEGAPTLSFDVEVAMELPPMAWMEAAPLEMTDATEAELRRAYSRLHAALAGGESGAREALAPFIARQATAIGATADQFFGASLAPIFAEGSGFELQPIDPAAGDAELFGGGRLAALVPIPLVFANEAAGQQGTLFIYLWKDAAGTWQVIH